MTDDSVRLEGVVHRWPNAGGETAALDGVDLVLAPGTVTALAGPNGSGKTTLLRIAAGIVESTGGAVDVLGVPDPARRGRRARRPLRHRVAYAPQDPALDPDMTGRETLRLLAVLHGLPRIERNARLDAVVAVWAPDVPLDRPVSTLSGGQRRRLHLAGALVGRPDLVLLDEPGAGLDAAGSDALWNDLRRRADDGAAVAVVTHDLAAASRHTDTVVILAEGRVVGRGAPSELGPDLDEAYRRHTGVAPGPPDRRGGRGDGRGRGRARGSGR